MAALSAAACEDPVLPNPGAPRDSTAPRLYIVSPRPSTFDPDGDQYVDIQVWWDDPGGAIDSTTLRIRSLTGLNGPADTTTNLIGVWKTSWFTRDSIHLQETLENLLHGGANELEITLSDTAGNSRKDTVRFNLPHGAFLKSVFFGPPVQGVTVCPDDNRVYVAGGSVVGVIDADSLRLVGVASDPNRGTDFQKLLCIPGDSVVYVTGFPVARFDRRTIQLLSPVTGTFATNAIAISRANLDPDLIYVGEDVVGGVGLISRSQNQRIGSIALPPYPAPPRVVLHRLPTGADELRHPTLHRTGRQYLYTIPMSAQSPGFVMDVVLSKDEGRVFAAVRFPYKGIAGIPANANSVTELLVLAHDPFVMALSPSGSRLFVASSDDEVTRSPAPNVLIDVDGWSVLATFSRPKVAGTNYPEQDVVFRPDGKFVFVGHGNSLYVYLIRD